MENPVENPVAGEYVCKYEGVHTHPPQVEIAKKAEPPSADGLGALVAIISEQKDPESSQPMEEESSAPMEEEQSDADDESESTLDTSSDADSDNISNDEISQLESTPLLQSPSSSECLRYNS